MLLATPLLLAVASAAPAPRIGFIDPGSAASPGPRNAAALAFARTKGAATSLKPRPAGGWLAADGKVRAPEEFDVIWYHQGEAALPNIGDQHAADLESYVDHGGVLLLSGSAGALVNEMNIEPAKLRLIGPSDATTTCGIRVLEKHRQHPIFAGLDVSQPLYLTSTGSNALADFEGTGGPGGELLANGTYGPGERPLVEYHHGQGRILLVGWRLADFTAAQDGCRPNLERLFANMLQYLSESNANRASLVIPQGESSYVRIAGIPMLRSKEPLTLTAPADGAPAAVALLADPAVPDAQPVGEGLLVKEVMPKDGVFSATALAMTLTRQDHPVAALVARRKVEQDAAERELQKQLAGVRVVKAAATFVPAPLKPLEAPVVDQSVLLGRSPFMAPGDGWGDLKPVYQPLEDGGFRISGSRRQFNRMIIQNQNRLQTGDAPIFRMDTGNGFGTYIDDRIFPIFPRPDSQAGTADPPCLGTLRLGVPAADGTTRWLDELTTVTSTFRPGYSHYQVTDPDGRWKAEIVFAPAPNSNGLVCRVDFDREVPLIWQFGGVWWLPNEKNANHVEINGSQTRITETNLPNGMFLAGGDAGSQGRTVAGPCGQQAEFSAKSRKSHHIVAVWGVTAYDEKRAKEMMARLDTPISNAWPANRDALKKSWFDCFIGSALNPERRFNDLMAKPAEALKVSCAAWDKRRTEFQIHTPDAHLNALINWERTRNEYHRKGPGLFLGEKWQNYCHISSGWYGKEWGGDHQALDECLRLYGAKQLDNGAIGWVTPSLAGFMAENNTPYWVAHVWNHYTWTGDKQFVRDLWPAVRGAVAWQRKQNDPDGDLLFRDAYEYWNSDSGGKGPKAATPSATSWAMLDSAARLAAVVGDAQAGREYRDLADQCRTNILAQLWNDKIGLLGTIGTDNIWRSHPQAWDEYLAINAGLLSPVQGRRAMRWLESHYGFEPQPGVKLLACSDWYPLRWSNQWVPTGDTCLAAMAGLKSGDVDLWWPYIQTAVMSAFKNENPGIGMGISNFGVAGGDIEDVDSADPYTHLVLRGVFGIEPAIHEGRIDICPAFPPAWTEASIRTPDISYEYRRTGNQATFKIHSRKPWVKQVRANLTGKMVASAAETDSVVSVTLGALPAPPAPPATKPILLEKDGKPVERPVVALTAAQRQRLVLIDLATSYNKTIEEMYDLNVTFDHGDSPGPLYWWWRNPRMLMPPTPQVLEAPNGVRFLTPGRTKPGMAAPPKNVIALSSWQPYPVPGSALVPVGLRCRNVWPLLYSYVHPSKNYLPNGEIVLHYAGGKTVVESLIPPFNLCAAYQHANLKGIPVPLGRINPEGFGFVYGGPMTYSHADALQVACDPALTLESIEFRAVCSEGILGVAGLTVEAAD
jgi:hypothetical protein